MIRIHKGADTDPTDLKHTSSAPFSLSLKKWVEGYCGENAFNVLRHPGGKYYLKCVFLSSSGSEIVNTGMQGKG